MGVLEWGPPFCDSGTWDSGPKKIGAHLGGVVLAAIFRPHVRVAFFPDKKASLFVGVNEMRWKLCRFHCLKYLGLRILFPDRPTTFVTGPRTACTEQRDKRGSHALRMATRALSSA